MKQLCLPAVFVFSILIFFSAVEGHSTSLVKDKTPLELEKKAAALAEEALLELSLLESAENQIVVLILATDLFWTRDEKRARQTAQETAAKIRAALVPTLENDEAARLALLFPGSRYNRLRRDFLVMLAGRDAAFAQELAAETRPLLPILPPVNQSEQTQLRNWNVEERGLEQKIAFQAAANNIGEAVKIARRSLARGISKESLNFLRRLQIKNGEAANTFADELIQKLTAADFNKDSEASETVVNLLFQLDEKQGVFGMPRSCNCPAKPLVVDAAKIRRLAGKWLDFAVAQPNEKISHDFLEATPVLRKLLPERAAAIQTKFAAISKSEPQKLKNIQLQEKIEDDKTPPEAIAALALKEPEGKRFHLYRQAFVKAANHSKAALEKLLESISAHPEGEDKNWLTNEIAANLAGKTAEDGDLDKALELAQRVVKKDRRLGLLSFLALEFLEKGDTTKARQISDEIKILMDLKSKDKMPKAIVGYNIFPGLFRTFALVDTEQALNLLEFVMPEATEMLTAGFPTSNVDARIDLRTIIIRNAYVLSRFAKPIRKIAETDFDRTRRLTVYLNKPELAVLAKLLLAQSVLQGKLGYINFADRQEMIILSD